MAVERSATRTEMTNGVTIHVATAPRAARMKTWRKSAQVAMSSSGEVADEDVGVHAGEDGAQQGEDRALTPTVRSTMGVSVSWTTMMALTPTVRSTMEVSVSLVAVPMLTTLERTAGSMVRMRVNLVRRKMVRVLVTLCRG